MPGIDLICLANSRKHGGRCIAGLKVDGSGWLRPVSPRPDGTFGPFDYILTDRSEPALLDKIKVGLQKPRPLPHQPENWVIDRARWNLLARPMEADLVPILKAALVSGPELLCGFSDRVSSAHFQQHPAAASLALVAPEEVSLYHQPGYHGRTQARGRFSLGMGNQKPLYDLVITDPRFETMVMREGPGTLSQSYRRFLLTISLGEPCGLNCFKLIAAVIFLPPRIAAVF